MERRAARCHVARRFIYSESRGRSPSAYDLLPLGSHSGQGRYEREMPVSPPREDKKMKRRPYCHIGLALSLLAEYSLTGQTL